MADTALAVVGGLLTSPGAAHPSVAEPAAALVQAALWLPLIARRRAPEAVFAVLALVGLAQWLLGLRLLGDLALLVALYTVAAHRRREAALAAAAVLEVGVLMATARWAPGGGGILGSLLFLSGLVAAALFLGITLRTRRDYLASLLDRAQRLERERDAQTRLATAAERTRIAREMHDILAHSLAVMITLADAAALTNRSRPEEAETAMRQASATGRAALAETRRLLGVLRTDNDAADPASAREPQPGLARLDELLEGVRATGLVAELTVSGRPFALPPSAGTAVYRIVQEALTNAVKHARGAQSVRVRLRYDAPDVLVEVRDDGQGGPPSTGGHGLTGMRERAALFGGTVSAGPVQGGGWAVATRLRVRREDA